tara:strand:+ start:1899 stop:2669 length:771 start_codon:yes stop_codon:yes gene_type:complete
LKINNKTKLFLSISSTPGNTGAKFHNFYYKKFKLNNVYFPIKLNNLSNINFLKDNDSIGGFSVSMPFKEKIIKHIEYLDKISKKTKSVNTVKVKNNRFFGFNTDYYGVKDIFKIYNLKNNKSILLLGNGGMANTIRILLNDLKFKKIHYSSRNPKRYKNWNINKKNLIDWSKRGFSKKYDLLINATPLGMWNNNNLPVPKSNIKNFEVILDCAVNDKSKLRYETKMLKKKYIPGSELTKYQAKHQFKIYTGKKISS